MAASTGCRVVESGHTSTYNYIPTPDALLSHHRPPFILKILDLPLHLSSEETLRGYATRGIVIDSVDVGIDFWHAPDIPVNYDVAVWHEENDGSVQTLYHVSSSLLPSLSLVFSSPHLQTVIRSYQTLHISLGSHVSILTSNDRAVLVQLVEMGHSVNKNRYPSRRPSPPTVQPALVTPHSHSQLRVHSSASSECADSLRTESSAPDSHGTLPPSEQ